MNPWTRFWRRLAGHLDEPTVMAMAWDCLDPKTLAAARAHVKRCLPCAEYLRRHLDLADGLALRTPLGPLPEDYVVGILKTLEPLVSSAPAEEPKKP